MTIASVLFRRPFPVVLTTALICLVATVGTACHRAVNPDPVNTKAADSLRVRDFYPLAVGNRWTYETRLGNRTETQTVEIVAEEHGFHRDTAGGLLRVDSEGLRDPQRYLLRTPLEPGNSWSVVLAPGVSENYEIVDAGSSCSVPAGTFARCVTVRGQNRVDGSRQLVSEWTYAEGIGLVSLHTRIEKGERNVVPQVEMRLVSFDRAQ